tara:strand:- start:3668 stop:3967 length:300 start_codon:yes stop_codon:yes gene_type:complete
MKSIINKNRKAEEMRKTFDNAKKIVAYRLEEERLRKIQAKEEMMKYPFDSEEFKKADLNYESALNWESCLEYLLEFDLTDFKLKYFEEFKRVQDEIKNK